MLELDQRFLHCGQSIAWGRMGEGEPIVLVHGFPWSSQAWRHIAPWLAKTHSVYFFDMLGCGQSGKNDVQCVDESVQSDLLAALIEYWQLTKPQVVGHDFGGLAALRAHFINGVGYGKLHLIDPVALMPSGSPFYAHVAQHELAFAGLPGFAHKALFRAYIQQAAHYPLRQEAVDIYFDPWRNDVGQRAFYRQIAQADADYIEEVARLYKAVDFDVHLIWGAEDTFIPLTRGEQLRRQLSANSLTVVSNAGHLVQEDAPEAVLGALVNHL